jgi:nicotinamide-nucleotide amidase
MARHFQKGGQILYDPFRDMNKNSKVHRFITDLTKRSLTLAFAESMTCGLAAHTLSTCKGTSEVLKGSIVCYNGEVKTGLMGISPAYIKRYSAESREVTLRLAQKLRKLISADIYAAITGLASPGGSEGPGKPVGTVFFVVLYGKKRLIVRRVFRGSPLQIREKASLYLMEVILRAIRDA